MDDTWWKKLNELDETQQEIIELDIDGDYLVVGPPGCGKTNILLLRASYYKSAGLENCNVITYTRSLREFIASGKKVPKKWVRTLASWARLFLQERGRDTAFLNEELSEPEMRRLAMAAVEEEIGKLPASCKYYDAILIDEIQDYSEYEVSLFRMLTSRLYVVGDDRQRIFAPTNGTSAALKFGCQPKRLKAHYRMGRKICEVADRLSPDGGSLLSGCYYDEDKLPSEVRLHQGDLAAQLVKMHEILDRQIKIFPGQWFGVLAATWATLNVAIEYLEANGFSGRYKIQRDNEDRAFDPECPICVMTIHSAKGGEFRGVHLLAADVFPYYTREKAFTAVTRAKTTLDIYHDRDMDQSLQTALAKRRVPKIDLE